jgi:AraC-like DNA-binding protein
MSASACLVPKIDRQLWYNPFTSDGVRLPAGSAQGGFQIHEAGVMVLDENWLHRGVCSPFWRLFYDFTPGAWVEAGGRRHALGPNRIVVMPDGAPFDCGSGRGVEHLWLHFSLYLSLAHAAPGVFALPAGPVMQAIAKELRGQVVAREANAVQHLSSALLHLVFAEGPVGRIEAMPERLRKLFNWIENMLDGAITNEAMAGQAGMSVEAFIRWFKARTGRTPAAFVAERRIREACRLLAFSEDSIEQVAEGVGFTNRHHFSRVFKRYAGCGPAEFRRGRSNA